VGVTSVITERIAESLPRLSETMSNERSKWLTFYKLRDALGMSGCAVCRLTREASLHYLGSLFHEFVTDPTTRAWLQAADGFCNWHAWLALHMPDTESGLATIYETILEVILKRFSRIEAAITSHPAAGLMSKLLHYENERLAPLLERTGECKICVSAVETELSYLHELVIWFDDEELRAAFDRSFGLCLPHLDLLIARYPHEDHLPAILTAERQKCEALHGELGEYLRKLDFENNAEPRGAEQDSWRRVVELCVGKARIFNSRMQRDSE
jgi:hypothetical protein